MCLFVGILFFCFSFVRDLFVRLLACLFMLSVFSCPVYVFRLVLLHLCAGGTCPLTMTRSTESLLSMTYSTSFSSMTRSFHSKYDAQH